LAATASGSLAAGVYRVAYAYENANGRTLISAPQSVTLSANQKITVTAVSPPAGVSAVIWFVSPEKDSAKLREYVSNDGSGFVVDALPSLNAALPNDFNKTGTEVLRVEYVFSDAGSIRTNRAGSNVLKDSYKFILGRREESTNLIKLSFRDATQDFRLVEMVLRDEEHIAKIKKENKKEIDGSGIDSFHQAYRIASGVMAEQRDANFFYQNESDREALFVEEGDVVCVTDAGAGIVNLPVIVEDIEYSDLEKGLPKAQFVMRKYSSTLYDDSVVEREIPVYQGLADPLRPVPNASTVLPIDEVDFNVDLEGVNFTLLVDASAAARTVNLPAAAVNPGKLFNIKKIDSSGNTVTIEPAGAETIDGAGNKVLTTQYEKLSIQSDGAAWWII
jgi:hypothetical protein